MKRHLHTFWYYATNKHETTNWIWHGYLIMYGFTSLVLLYGLYEVTKYFIRYQEWDWKVSIVIGIFLYCFSIFITMITDKQKKKDHAKS